MATTLTQYGRRELVVAIAVSDLLVLCLAAAAVLVSAWFVVPMLPVALVAAWVVWFFRDPDRTPPDGEGLLVSPADGRVADVTPVGADSALGRPGVKVGIFMNIFNVHVNRSPARARVVRTEHSDGLYLDARDPDAAFRNESATVHLLCEHRGREMPLVVRQVAGKVARRIVTDLREGQSLARGERFGMIKFGSRLELTVPDDAGYEVRVSVGEIVRAGETVLFAERKAAQ